MESQIYRPTPERIAELKAKHGDIFLLQVEDKACIMKTPDRKTLSYATKAAEKDPLAFNEAILNNCFLEGDEEIKNDDRYFLGAASQLQELVQVKQASIAKL